ncbi:Camphene synthase [Pseudonocardiaceae bacterium YIM PH 21723]|nr:Camphene synthase [Pseudonocardiaceae bacterium YIM PH 21723]
MSSLFVSPSTHSVAAFVESVLADIRQAPPSALAELLNVPHTEVRQDPSATTALSGLGTAAARMFFPDLARPRVDPTALITLPDDDSELFCPGPVRDDPALGELVNEQLVAWAGEMGIYPDRLDHLRRCGFGRMIMLAHPGCDDPDRLLAATKVMVAEWASDDYYLDESEVGADPATTAAKFGLLYGVVDPVALPARYTSAEQRYLQEEPIARAFRDSMEHLAQYTTTAQMARFQHQMAILFTTLDQNASWRHSGARPKAWEYLSHRQHNSYLPPMILCDVLSGYELSPQEFYFPPVRRAVLMIGLAAVLINDIHSAAKEHDDDISLPEAISEEENCSLEQAVRETVAVHNELMKAFVAEATVLSAAGSPALRRFFTDLWAWCGGSREWHATTLRYRSEQSSDREPAPAV